MNAGAQKERIKIIGFDQELQENKMVETKAIRSASKKSQKVSQKILED